MTETQYKRMVSSMDSQIEQLKKNLEDPSKYKKNPHRPTYIKKIEEGDEVN